MALTCGYPKKKRAAGADGEAVRHFPSAYLRRLGMEKIFRPHPMERFGNLTQGWTVGITKIKALKATA